MSFGSDAETEGALRARMTAEGLRASAWSNGPGDQYPPHRHDFDKVIVVAAGSITFELPEADRSFELRARDRLALPAGTLHGARWAAPA